MNGASSCRSRGKCCPSRSIQRRRGDVTFPAGHDAYIPSRACLSLTCFTSCLSRFLFHSSTSSRHFREKAARPGSTRHFVRTATASAAWSLPLSSSRREAPWTLKGRTRLSITGRCTRSILGTGHICQSRNTLTELMSKDSCGLPKSKKDALPTRTATRSRGGCPQGLLRGSKLSSPLPESILIDKATAAGARPCTGRSQRCEDYLTKQCRSDVTSFAPVCCIAAAPDVKTGLHLWLSVMVHVNATKLPELQPRQRRASETNRL